MTLSYSQWRKPSCCALQLQQAERSLGFSRRNWNVLSMPWKFTQCEHRIAESLYSLATPQIRQFDHESAADDRSAGDAYQPERRFGRAAGGNQVVDEQHVLAALNPIGVQLQPVGAVLELVVVAEVFGGELPLFADRHQADVQSVSE